MVTGTRIAGGEGGRWLNEGVRRIVNYGWLASIEVGELAGTDKSLEAQGVSEKLEWYLSKNRVSLPSGECVCQPTRSRYWFHSSPGFSLTQHLLPRTINPRFGSFGQVVRDGPSNRKSQKDDSANAHCVLCRCSDDLPMLRHLFVYVSRTVSTCSIQSRI